MGWYAHAMNARVRHLHEGPRENVSMKAMCGKSEKFLLIIAALPHCKACERAAAIRVAKEFGL